MAKLNPIEKSQYINDQYKEYLKSSFVFDKSTLQKLFVEQLEKEDLFKGPYVDMVYPFERGQSLNELIDKGIVCESFKELQDVHLDRPLYLHQQESIEKISQGKSTIVTTGTGSGKTECFLYPILNELLKDVENGNRDIGIRAIFLYPLNALVNDQVERIRNILSDCESITFGFFTGETPNHISEAERNRLKESLGGNLPVNELLSREEIRENPPHLLFTNYSMLEYLLIRPNDYAIFDPDRLKNWKFVVLDEAHTYNGSLGIELSLLMRRLTGMAPRKPQFILTSATLGQQGKSEADIVRFATSLTSVKYDVEDIIFSKRLYLNNDFRYRVSGEDYLCLKDSLSDVTKVKSIVSRYIQSDSDNVRELLYELLSHDNNVDDISRILKDGSLEFAEILSRMNEYVQEKELIALIDLINFSEKDGLGLFDLKYHSFVRPLSGAYITYGKNEKLSLTKTNEIDGMKAFEIGNCRYCSAPYIIGKICKREDDQKDYLIQNKEIDIYENYGNEESVKLDYFLLDKPASDEENKEGKIEECEVCGKCGAIHTVRNLNALKCDCDDSYKFKVFKVLQKKEKDEDLIYNNINHCPCCGHRGKSGVVKGLNIGKDEGTALIAQMLYEAIDEGEQEKTKIKKLSLKPRSSLTPNAAEEQINVKQYLSFSDSRQQASFAAVFFDSNHVRMLRKRLIWEAIEENNYKNIDVDNLAAILTTRIKKNDLFANTMSAHKNAWLTLLVDLLSVDGAYDGEGLGLYYFDLDIDFIVEQFTNDAINEAFSEYGIKGMTKEELRVLFQIVFELFKTTPAIDYTKSTLTPDETENLEYRRFKNYISLQSAQGEKNIRSLLPIKGEENAVVRYVSKAFGCTSDESKEVISSLFDLLLQANDLEGTEKLLETNDKKNAYQIYASRYVLKNYKTSDFYKCSKCGRLTPYNIRNKCPRDKCEGVLSLIDPDIDLASNYYRQKYKTKKIERIVIKEHTAQLESKLAKEYQEDFKNKKINILSCSTTFEMGIDIGGLETVYMRNVPPTPANYVQRAGRAGRRKDSSAFILTYCGVSSHDYTYFKKKKKMISGVINPPFFNVVNRKIIDRHLMAASLGYFFRKNPKYFNSLEALIQGGIPSFYEYVNSHPNDLNEYINKKILPEPIYSDYWNFAWLDEMGGKDEKMEFFLNTINDMIAEFEQARDDASGRGDYKEAD